MDKAWSGFAYHIVAWLWRSLVLRAVLVRGLAYYATSWLGVRFVVSRGLALDEVAYTGLVRRGVCMLLVMDCRAVEWRAALASLAISLLLNHVIQSAF